MPVRVSWSPAGAETSWPDSAAHCAERSRSSWNWPVKENGGACCFSDSVEFQFGGVSVSL